MAHIDGDHTDKKFALDIEDTQMAKDAEGAAHVVYLISVNGAYCIKKRYSALRFFHKVRWYDLMNQHLAPPVC